LLFVNRNALTSLNAWTGKMNWVLQTVTSRVSL
jgi:hypothetical protein